MLIETKFNVTLNDQNQVRDSSTEEEGREV